MDKTILVNKENLLSEFYIPENMVVINEPTGIKMDKTYKNMLDQEAYYYFKLMQRDAKKEGYNIYIDSSYRSYEFQQKVYQKIIERFGEEQAKLQCALPGSSEHQTGLAFDVIISRDGEMLEEFDETYEEIIWMMNNCYKYGYILRYPKNKIDITGYTYEPWHYRYVGLELAQELHNTNECLEEYYKRRSRK